MASNPSQTKQDKARQQAKYNILDEPLEVLKTATSQVTGQEQGTEKQAQAPQPQPEHPASAEGYGSPRVEAGEVKEEISKERQTGMMQAFKRELEEMKELQDEREQEMIERKQEAEEEKKQKEVEKEQLEAQAVPEVSSKPKTGFPGVPPSGQAQQEQDIFRKERQTEIRTGPQG